MYPPDPFLVILSILSDEALHDIAATMEAAIYGNGFQVAAERETLLHWIAHNWKYYCDTLQENV
jgi:hypothetical protein